MKAVLVFPPVSDPRGPHLAPAALAAALRSAGCEVKIKDVDLEVALFFLRPDFLKTHLELAEKKLKSLPVHGHNADWEVLAWRQKLTETIETAQPLIRTIPDYINILRSESFYNRDAYFSARKAIDAALSLICSVYDYRLQYRIDGQAFVTRYKYYRLDELLKAVADTDANLFGTFYSRTIIPDIIHEKPDLVGISILNYQQVLPGLTLAKFLMQTGVRVVIGGTVYSKFLESLRRAPQFFSLCDGVVMYEGESSLIAFVKELEKNPENPDLTKIPNLIWFDGNNVRVNEPFHAENLSRLPTPDFSGFPLNEYLAPERVLPYNLGKGCYWNRCKFCEIPFINNLPGTNYRIKPVPLIVDQLEELSQKCATPYFQFTDESCSPELLEEIADEIISRTLQIFYLCYARLESGFTARRLKKLRKSGLRKLMLGLESGSDHTLKKINKGITAAQAETVIHNCHAAGVNFRLFVILGFPGETIEDAWETRNFLRRVAPMLRNPFNSFEINLFHLDTHSCYAQHTDEYGISWKGTEDGEFFLGGDRFTCKNSMNKKMLHQFIGEVRKEMYQLAEMTQKHSGWEEYSLLTICHEEEKVKNKL
jgi:hypothetical protein